MFVAYELERKEVRKDSYGEVTITDITGKIIYTTTSGETQMLEVNILQYCGTEGVYIVRILREESFGQEADVIEMKKLLIQK